MLDPVKDIMDKTRSC